MTVDLYAVRVHYRKKWHQKLPTTAKSQETEYHRHLGTVL